METIVILQQIIIAGLIILVGAVGTWVKVINESVRLSMSKLVFNITLPLLIFTTFANMEINQELIHNGMWIIVFSFLAFFLFYVVGVIVSKVHKLPTRWASIHVLHTMFGNIVFLGFPLINALFPQKESMLYAALYYLVSSLIMWTFGVALMKGEKVESWQKSLKNLINPNTIAFALGIILMITKISIPDLVHQTLSGIGKTTIQLSLMYVGALLAQTPIRGLAHRKDIVLLSLNKLLLIPILVLFIIEGLIAYAGLEISYMAKTIIVLQAGMPCMSIIVILAKHYGAEDVKAAENVFVTTILSLATLSFLYVLINMLNNS